MRLNELVSCIALKMEGLKYMPLPKSQHLDEKLPCDGALLMIEITEEVHVPGGKRWKDIVDMEEHRRIMQLFLFTLGVCVDMAAPVCLEAVVSEEFKTLHNKTLSNMVHVLGHRLWIPLKWVRAL
jgi:hypothetical protein